MQISSVSGSEKKNGNANWISIVSIWADKFFRCISKTAHLCTHSQSANRFGSRYILGLAISGEKVDTRVRDTIHRVVIARRAKTRRRRGRTLSRPTRRDVSEDFTKSDFKQRKADAAVIDKYEIIGFGYFARSRETFHRRVFFVRTSYFLLHFFFATVNRETLKFFIRLIFRSEKISIIKF